MQPEEKAADLFFQLASVDRKRILLELQRNSLHLNETAKKLGMTATETLRQLQRLSEASLIQRQPDGSYAMTEYGRLVLQLSSSVEFVSEHREYFLTHDVRCLPRQFLDRLGVLAAATLTLETTETLNGLGRAVADAKEFMWAAGMESPLNIGPPLGDKIAEGVTFRFILPERLLPPQASERNAAVEWRVLDSIPVNLVVTEKEGGITFPLPGGKADYVGFGGKNPAFHGWLKDLFGYYWEKGKRNPNPKRS